MNSHNFRNIPLAFWGKTFLNFENKLNQWATGFSLTSPPPQRLNPRDDVRQAVKPDFPRFVLLVSCRVLQLLDRGIAGNVKRAKEIEERIKINLFASYACTFEIAVDQIVRVDASV